MSHKLSEQDVFEALKSSKNGTYTGVNGLPYELWTTFNNKYEADVKADKPTFNIIRTLTRVFNDIEEYGVVLTTNLQRVGCALCIRKKTKDK